jgi:hypothetical protein
MQSTTGGGTLRWRQVFSGEERILRALRDWLASLLPACPSRDDVISVANELASNAIRHTASGRGGKYAVEITCSQAVVRVTVADGGAPTGPLRTGVIGNRHGRLVWAEIPWTVPSLAAAQQDGPTGTGDASPSEPTRTCSPCPFDVGPAESRCHFSGRPRYDENCCT